MGIAQYTQGGVPGWGIAQYTHREVYQGGYSPVYTPMEVYQGGYSPVYTLGVHRVVYLPGWCTSWYIPGGMPPCVPLLVYTHLYTLGTPLTPVHAVRGGYGYTVGRRRGPGLNLEDSLRYEAHRGLPAPKV